MKAIETRMEHPSGNKGMLRLGTMGVLKTPTWGGGRKGTGEDGGFPVGRTPDLGVRAPEFFQALEAGEDACLASPLLDAITIGGVVDTGAEAEAVRERTLIACAKAPAAFGEAVFNIG